MHEPTRHALAAALPGVEVIWFGRALGAQGASSRAIVSAVSDMWLMGAGTEARLLSFSNLRVDRRARVAFITFSPPLSLKVMITPGSTFGYVAHAISGGRATMYGGTHTSHDLIGATSIHDCREARRCMF